MISELWGYVQSNKFYKDNTYFIITTDHGRGLMEGWSGHGTSQASWLAILGPSIEKTGLVEGEFFTNQIAETIMQITKKSKTKIPTD
jgi:hypothetical protein